MSQLVVGILFLLITYASSQEQMTCYRNNGCSQSPLDSTSNASCPTVQGKPGKRGANGTKGEMGFKGSKGDKGDPDSSLATQINNLNTQIEELSRNLTAKINAVEKLLLGSPVFLNGYIYWLTLSRQSWQNSRDECRILGGDLASVGVKTTNERRTLKQSFSTSLGLLWLGGNDLRVEGTFRWLDGTLVGSSEWSSGQPTGGTDLNYLCMHGSGNRHGLNDCFNRANLQAVCSKR